MVVNFPVTDGKTGKPVPGVNISYGVEKTGLNFPGESDGNGDGHTEVPGDKVPFPHTAQISIQHPGYTMPKIYRVVTEDKGFEVPLVLVPFVRSGGGVSPIEGLIVRDGKHGLKDDKRSVHLMGMTFFWGPQGAKFDGDRWILNLDWLADKPYKPDILRELFEVDWPGWACVPPTGKTPTAPWPDWAERVAQVIDMNKSVAGCLTEACIGGKGTGCDYLAVTDLVCDILLENDRWKLVPLMEMINESGDYAIMIEMAKIIRRRLPGIASVALSNTGKIDDEEIAWSKVVEPTIAAGGTCITIHSDRNPGDNKWRQVRQMHDNSADEVKDFLVSQNEPPGIHSSLEVNHSALQLALMRFLCHISGGAHYVLHVGDMVKGQKDDGHHREANLWEITDPDLLTIMKAVRGVDQWLPDGVENWNKSSQSGTHGYPGHPLTADGIWSDNNTDHGVDRAYSANNGHDFVEAICGVFHYVNMIADRNLHVKVYDPVSAELVLEQDVAGGQSIRLEGREDTMAGYIAVGNWT